MSDFKITNWTVADQTMVETAIRRGANRRQMLKLLMAGGVSLAVGDIIFGQATSAIAATPTMGGALKAAGWSSSTADTLDPAKASLSTDYVRICSIYNRLTFLDANSVPQMELAESIETKDAKTWTVKLRSGVTFHNGKDLTADDVVYSLQRHVNKETGSKVNSIAKQMTGFKAVDNLTVEIELATPNADLPTILSMHHFMIVPDGTTDFTKGIGTGPFKLEVFEPSVKSIVTKNPNYFKAEGPYLDSFEFFGISDDTARVNAMLSGDIHIAGGIDPRSMKLIDSQPGFAMVKNTGGNYTNLNMRLDMSPGEKMDFITGMKYLLDREVIKNSVMRGLAEVANDQPISPANAFHNKDLKPKPFDPDKAKYHFEKAGLLGQTIPIVASDAATASVEMCTVIQDAASKIGMDFDVQKVPADGYWSNYWLKAPIHFGNINPRPTADILFSLLYASDAPWNESKFKSEKFDQMLIEARGSLDVKKRKAIYDDMQVMVAEEAGTAIPAYLSGVDAMSDKVGGFGTNPLGGLMGYAFPEYVWLKT